MVLLTTFVELPQRLQLEGYDADDDNDTYAQQRNGRHAPQSSSSEGGGGGLNDDDDNEEDAYEREEAARRHAMLSAWRAALERVAPQLSAALVVGLLGA